ncbi:MAG: FAD:protein FMN transferase [Clostridia bacterium]|nr:FAD:protein FMN transferase [Clostridia bacterium]
MRKFIIVASAVLILLFSSCGEKTPEKFTAYYFDWFDTATTIVGYADNKEDFDAVCADISAQFTEYHRLYNIYNHYDGLTNLYTVNHSDGTVEVDERITDMLAFSKEAYTLTNGNTNVAMGSVLSLWHNARTHGERHPESAALPDMEKLKAASLHTDIEKVIIDEDNNTVTLLDGEMSLDVGAIAKGYAVEMVAKSLEEKEISGYLLNVGGNVRAVGARPDGTKWTVGIENPDAESEDEAYLAYLAVESEAVVTSGSYQRYYYVDGKAYHHIIDPETLMPGENFRSVSVICDSSALGDALSTALFCMSAEEGSALVDSLENVEAMWVLPTGEIKYSAGFEKYMK